MTTHLVRLINGKIAELDTGSPECCVPLPDQCLGRHLDSLRYVGGEFVDDPEWIAPARPPAGLDDSGL